jgi:peroxiredoxin family protein
VQRPSICNHPKVPNQSGQINDSENDKYFHLTFWGTCEIHKKKLSFLWNILHQCNLEIMKDSKEKIKKWKDMLVQHYHEILAMNIVSCSCVNILFNMKEQQLNSR